MNARLTVRVALMALLVAACSTTVAPTPAPTPVPTIPRMAPTVLPATPEPSPTNEIDTLPSTSVFGWWEEGVHYGCHPPAYVRVDGAVTALGVCPGALDDSPQRITVDVGQDFDIHMAVHSDGSPPIYPLPVAADPLVADGWLIFDQATMTYRALLPGTTRLMTTGTCWISDSSPTGVHDIDGPCPVLEVRVRDVKMTCTDVTEDLCRAAASGAVGTSWAPVSPGRLVGWEVTPYTIAIDWPGCGHVFAKVTFDLRDPVEKVTVSMGQLEPDTHPLEVAECTY